MPSMDKNFLDMDSPNTADIEKTHYLHENYSERYFLKKDLFSPVPAKILLMKKQNRTEIKDMVYPLSHIQVMQKHYFHPFLIHNSHPAYISLCVGNDSSINRTFPRHIKKYMDNGSKKILNLPHIL
jgi:hypothetical protein